MKVLIFGIGSKTDYIIRKIKKNHIVIGYSDSFLRIPTFDGKKFYRFDELDKASFDYIVITASSSTTISEIYQSITNKLGDDTKIIPFYTYASNEKYKLRIGNSNHKMIKGLVFGNSVSRDGILTNQLKLPFENISFGGADLFFINKIWNLCTEEYADRLRGCEYIVIDVYCHLLFNFDASLEKGFFEIIRAFGGGRIIEKRNYNENKFFYNLDFGEQLWKRVGLGKTDDAKKKAFTELFIDEYGYDYQFGEKAEDPYSRWQGLKDEEKYDFPFKRHEKTLLENKRIFEDLIKNIYRFNPNMKIIITSLPWYYDLVDGYYSKELHEFCEITDEYIKQMCDAYNLKVLDLRSRKEVYEEKSFFYNAQHLNTKGASYITSILNDYIK